MSIAQAQHYKYEGWKVGDGMTVHLIDYELEDYLTPMKDSVNALLSHVTDSKPEYDQMIHNLSQSCGHKEELQAAQGRGDDIGEAVVKAYDEKLGGDRDEWYGGMETIADADAILWDGWSEGATRLSEFAEELDIDAQIADAFEDIPDARRKRVWKDEGDEIEMDRVYCGQLDRAWRGMKPSSARMQAISLVVPFGGNAGCDAESLFWNGATGIVLAHLLELNGYSVEIVACHASEQGADERRKVRGGKKVRVPKGDCKSVVSATMIRVKRRDEPVRFDALAAITCHAGTFRTHGFVKDISLNQDGSFSTPWGLGHHVSVNAADFTQWPLDGEPIVVCDAFDKDAARQAILNVLDEVGGGKENAA